MRNILLITCLLCLPVFACSQKSLHNKGDIFDDSLVHRIEIWIDPNDLAVILDNFQSDIVKPADLLITTVGRKDSLKNVGFRIKGNASRFNDKKSYKLIFNEYEEGESYLGYEKISVNAFWNDPTHLRAHLATELFHAMEIPVARSSFADLYLNGKYQGLYNLVEQIDEHFVGDRFGSGNGNLYKCYSPADMKYLGDDPDIYRKLEMDRQAVYELKTNKKEKDFSGLAELIRILNNTPIDRLEEELDKRFNTDSYLRTLAVDVLIGNWDSQLFSANNFYLYDNPLTGKFEFIPYDFDNTFGIDWVGDNWGKKNIYDWLHHQFMDMTEEELNKFSPEVRKELEVYKATLLDNRERPLYTRILEVEHYRKKYEEYLNILVKNYFNTEDFLSLIDRHIAMISPSLQADTLDNFSWEQIQLSVTHALDVYLEFGNWKQYYLPYGLKDFISVSGENILRQLDKAQGAL